jgi:hypothetical protein
MSAVAFVCPPLVCPACELGNHDNKACHSLFKCNCACTLDAADLNFVLALKNEFVRRARQLETIDRLRASAAANHEISARHFRVANDRFKQALALELVAAELEVAS